MKNIILLISVLLFTSGCTNKIKSDNVQSLNTTDNIIRFDKDFYAYLLNPSKRGSNSLIEKYPSLLPAVGLTTINLNMNENQDNFFAAMVDYFDHPMLLGVYKDAITKFNDASAYEKQRTTTEQLIVAQLPNKKLPSMAFHVSGFKENVIVLKDTISISIDKYLGRDYEIYQSYFFGYQLQQMQPQMLIRDYLKAWILSDNLIVEEKEADLLSAMIKEGKVLYILSSLLPDYADYDLIGYTKEQLEQAKSDEGNMWQTIVKQSHLFSTDYTLIAKYTDEDFAADKTSVKFCRWIGWQIVSQYAKKTNATLTDILKTDARTILKNSRYNP